MDITTLKLKFLATLLGNYKWNKILKQNGIVSTAKLDLEKYYEVALKIYDKEFKGIDKNKTIKLEGLGKTYDNGFKAVHNLNLQIDPQDFVCLLGPSGCGKTTALRMLAGLDSITEGKYIMGNREMNHVHPSNRDTAMVFQNYALYPFMSVYNNVAFGLKLKTFKNIHIRDIVQEIREMKIPMIGEILDRKYEIYDLKHPLKVEINAQKILVKKLSKNPKKAAEFKEEQVKLTKMIQEAVKLKVSNQNKIPKIKLEIEKLKAKSAKLKTERKNKIAKHAVASKKEIEKLTLEAKAYYEQKKNLLPVLMAEKKKLTTEQKKINSEKLAAFKTISKKLSIAHKDAVNGAERIESLSAEYKKVSAEFEVRFSENSAKLVETTYEISIIKNSKQFQIEDIKNSLKQENSLFDKALNASIIWKKTIYPRVLKLAKLVGIENYLNRKPSELSGGQRQRVALIRAISKDAQMFLFDEPLSNLDAQLRSVMRSEIRKIHDDTGATSLYVTHDQIEAMTMSNKVVVMNLGYIQQVGHPKDLYTNPSNVFVAKFIGTPPMNILKVAKKADVITAFGKKIKLKLPKEKLALAKKDKSEEVVFGIRPQDIVVTKKSTNTEAIIGEVKSFELTGSEYSLNILVEGVMIKALVHNTITFENGDKVYMEFQTDKSHLFHLSNGVSITSEINAQTKAALKVWEESSEERIGNMMILDANKKRKVSIVKKAAGLVVNAVDKQANIKVTGDKISAKAKVYKDYVPVSFEEQHDITS